MKKMICLAVLLSSVLGPLAHAEGPGPNEGPGPQQWQEHERSGGPNGHDKREAQHREGDHFAWQGHDFRRGERAPERFRGDDYRLSDWRGRGLPEPPHGQHWAYIDGNYVLIAAATGIITSILLGGVMH